MQHFTDVRHDEIATRIGYVFKARKLLQNALTHSSIAKKSDDYQRLEFLGDRVLGLVIAEEIFRLNPGMREGAMANLHSNLVRGDVCGQVGRALELDRHIHMGTGEQNKGVNLNITVLGDVVEALIGGIYLDGGLDAARAFILHNWSGFLASKAEVSKDAKTTLQEWALGLGMPIPVYTVTKREGLEHSPIFTVELQVKDKESTSGKGPSKRAAEMAAAEVFLRREGLWS